MVGCKSDMKDHLGGGVLYVDCINANILAVRLQCSFTIYYHWEELSKGCMGSRCNIPYNCM